MTDRPLRIVEMAWESAPFTGTGELATSVGGLSRALARLGHDVHVILPRPPSMEPSAPSHREGEPHFWFVDAGTGGDHLRSAAYCRGALALIREHLSRPDVLHLHDWQTSLAVALLRGPGMPVDPAFEKTRLVFSIHHLAQTGDFGIEAIGELGLPEQMATPEGLEFYGRTALIKAGLMWSDALTTLSPRYAHEIQIPEYGCGFDALFRQRARELTGIVNGIDTDVWNPATDAALPARYGLDLAGKAECKAVLQRELGLTSQPRAPVLAVVSSLTKEKGIDLIADLAETITLSGGQLAVLGRGDPGLESWLTDIAQRFPGKCAVRIGDDERLLHRLLAGADLLLLPSRVEPCGQAQLWAMRYGTVPVVRAVGGLDDCVEELDSARGLGTGFKFGSAHASSLWAAIQRAFGAYVQPHIWNALARRCMARDFSWEKTAREYERVFG